jgi:hypothetical protein
MARANERDPGAETTNMTTARENTQEILRGSIRTSPITILLVVIIGLAGLLMLPLTAPIGPMYWDVFIYFDAANRILNGQVPINDFFAPVGPLGYYIFTGGTILFPRAQPVLLAHWSWLVVTAPLIALIIMDVDRRSRNTALALLIPFLVFAALPFNTRSFYPFPGSDGFGIYNRHTSQLLYILVAALIFVRSARLLCILVAVSMLALFFGKITGAVSGAILCLFALLAGRLSLRHAVIAALGFFAVLAIVEFTSGLVTNYLKDIFSLVAMNDETLAPRFVQSASLNFGVLASGLLLAALSAIANSRHLSADLGLVRREKTLRSVSRLLDNDALWLLVVLFAGVLFETQNTGSQAMILIWPAVLALLLHLEPATAKPKTLVATMALAGACVLPPLVYTVERAARAYIGAVKNVDMPNQHLKTLGAVNLRPRVMERTQRVLPILTSHHEAFTSFAKVGELPSPVLYSEFGFQIGQLIEMDRNISSLLELEQKSGIHFSTIMTLEFVNPYPWLMDRNAPKYVAIGADPFRAVPKPDSQELKAVRAVDIAILPTCPLTDANLQLLKIYQQGLAQHVRIKLNDCADALVNPRLAAKLPRR